MPTPDLNGRVAVVTGAGAGLGRAHALALARHGARVVLNDLAAPDGRLPAQAVADEITAAGGQALALAGDVRDAAAMADLAARTVAHWGRLDIVVNNAGILRDRSFAKMDLADFRSVLDVHLMGAVNLTHAAWPQMIAQRHGRVIFTTSSSGLYGNFGQANYGAAKMALVGLMQTLALEGAKHGIHVNCLAPTAATAMTADLLPPAALAALTVERVSPAVVVLASDAAPTRMILAAGAGSFESAHVTLTPGIHLPDGPQMAEALLQQLPAVLDRTGEQVPRQGYEQVAQALGKAGVPPAAA
jgi:NAD(P)-dependent dehydrogenase (short-subunit alcohol dehydrogenase family)